MLTRACQRCWHRKQKCDRESPECAACVAAGVRCLPRNYGEAPDSAATANIHNQPRSSIEYMKQRISYLEAEQAHIDQGANEEARNNHVSPAHAGRQTRPRTSSSNLEQELSGQAVTVTAGEVEYLSLAAMSGGDKNDQNISSSITFRKIMECILSANGTNPGLVAVDSSTPAQYRSTLTQIESEVTSAVGKGFLYFIRIFTTGLPWCLPFMTQATCVSALNAARQAEDSTNSTPDSTAIASLVLALGITVSPYYQVLHGEAVKLIDLSKQGLSRVLNTAADVTTIQCLLLQTILSLYYPSAGSTWHLLGLALSKAVSAGLHRSTSDTTASEEGTNTDTIFWMLYVLDRTLSSLMGRPLGLHDDDFALDLPELPNQQSLNNIAAVSEAMFVWRTHHARMLSLWRQSSKFDTDASFASYEYWKESYHEVCERLGQVETTQDLSDECIMASRGIMQRDQVTLSCRALAQLLDSSTKCLPANNGSLLELKRYIIIEASHIVDTMHKSIEDGKSALTFLDGYDALAVAVIYIYCIHDPSQPASFRLGISQMKTVTTSMDIIQSVAQQFKPLRAFKDVIWGLLQILEARAESRDVSGPLREINNCDIPIPNHVRRFIQLCTQP